MPLLWYYYIGFRENPRKNAPPVGINAGKGEKRMTIEEFNTINRKNRTRPEKIRARVVEFNGGYWGRPGEYIADLAPQYFKNGNVKKTDFNVVNPNTIERIKKGYRANCNASHSESIIEIMAIY